MNTNLPIVAITMGDPAGIGPEICLKALCEEKVYAACRPLIVGDAAILQRAASGMGLRIAVRPVAAVAEARFERGTVDVLDLHCVDLTTFRAGEVQPQCGDAAFRYVVRAIDLAMRDEVDATVTAPLNKAAMNAAGHHFDGHTEIYAAYTHTGKYAMLLADARLRVIHVSTHVSLRQACDLVKKDRIIAVTELITDACRQFGIPNPHIGISGLNPHAGENGLFGDEEAREIVPAVDELKARGFNVDGPLPPDSVFARARSGQYDGCVAMYHDQGHIAFKMAGFNWNAETGRMDRVEGVNITLGLPIIRVSVDHGTAFDIAGRGVANADAMLLSVDYASRMALYRIDKRRKG